MASIRREIVIERDVDDVWDVIRDFGQGPSRMAAGYVVDTHAEGDQRTVTFADGAVVRERLVAVDDEHRRIVYAIEGGSVCPTHDNASMQVFTAGAGRSRFVWVHDVLPDDLAGPLDTSMGYGVRAVKRTLESDAARHRLAAPFAASGAED